MSSPENARRDVASPSSPQSKSSRTAKASTPQRPDRPGHQLKRSLTEFASPTRLQRLQSHQTSNSRETGAVGTSRAGQHTGSQNQHHLHLHRGSLHFKRHHHHDEKASHPAAHPAGPVRHSIDLARPEAVTASVTPNRSRTPSLAVLNKGTVPGKTEPDEAEFKIEQKAAEARTEALKRAVSELTAFSTTTTKQLDDSYYSVLEKMSALQTTIKGLTELAENSQEICTTFEKDSQGLEHDIVTKLSSIGYFGDQQVKIEQLQGRISSGRDKMRTLSDRVEVIKDRIEGWDQADKEWQSKTRKRLMTIWAIIGTITVLIISIFVGLRFAPPNTVPNLAGGVIQDMSASVDRVAKQAETIVENIVEPLKEPTKGAAPRGEEDEGINTTLNWKMPHEGKGSEDQLRAFDEL